MKQSQISLLGVALWRVIPLALIVSIACYLLAGKNWLASGLELSATQTKILLLVILANTLVASAVTCWLCMRMVRSRAQLESSQSNSASTVELEPMREQMERYQHQLGLNSARQALMVEQIKALQPLTQAGGQCASLLHEVNTPAQFIGDNLAFIGDSHRQLTPLLEALEHCDPARLPDPVADAKEGVDLTFINTEIAQAIQQSVQGVEQITQVSQSARCWLHPDRQQRKAVQLEQIAEQAITLTRRQWIPVAEITVDASPQLPRVILNEPRILQVFINLISNACDTIQQSTQHNGQIRIRIRQQQDVIYTCISDNGSGIPPAVDGRLFEPFVTSKAPGRGTGLGLAICKDIIETEHGGSLSYTTRPGAGTTFSIEMPVHGQTAGTKKPT